MNEITNFKGQHWFLSNFYAARVTCDHGIEYPTLEHAFQAIKSLDVVQRRYIAELATPGEAKRAGRRLTLRPDWKKHKLSVMHWLVTQKFQRYPYLAKLLKATGDDL